MTNPRKYTVSACHYKATSGYEILLVLVPWEEFDHPLAMTVHKSELNRVGQPYAILSIGPDGRLYEESAFGAIWENAKQELDIESQHFHEMQVVVPDGRPLPSECLIDDWWPGKEFGYARPE